MKLRKHLSISLYYINLLTILLITFKKFPPFNKDYGSYFCKGNKEAVAPDAPRRILAERCLLMQKHF